MRKTFVLLIAFFFSATIHAQLSLTASTGFINYQGDLQPSSFTFNLARPYLSLGTIYAFTDKISGRFNLTVGKLEGQDKLNRDYLQIRNLSFYTGLQEAALSVHYSVFSLESNSVTPYLFGGASFFHFNPYARDTAGNYVHLQPLGTEGQGLAAYPNKKMYGLNQIALNFGGGVKFRLTDGINLIAELNQRKTMTDYLDDVSGSYADPNDLLAGRGAKSAELAFRGDELTPAQPFPGKGEQRGTARNKDWYYTLGVGIEVSLSKFTAAGNTGEFRRYKSRYGCPAVRP